MQIFSLKWSVLKKMPKITQIVYHDALLKTFMHLRGRCKHVCIVVYNNSYLNGVCRDYIEDSQNSMFFNINIRIVGDFLIIFLLDDGMIMRNVCLLMHYVGAFTLHLVWNKVFVLYILFCPAYFNSVYMPYSNTTNHFLRLSFSMKFFYLIKH